MANRDKLLTLTHAQYREFAELCKREAGKPLNLTSLEDLEDCWGMVTFNALPVMDDVSASPSEYWYDGGEKAYIYLANRVDSGKFRNAGFVRPECDWSRLQNSEIFPFIVWHEIGHIRDNFHPHDAWSLDPGARETTKGLWYVNEILADRFAWERIRPGEPMPLNENGKRNAHKIERDLATMGSIMKRGAYPVRPLPVGQYRSVPAYMLSSKRKAAYVGPDINPERLAGEIERHRDHKTRYGQYMHGVGL